jgi:hypothetical protein
MMSLEMELEKKKILILAANPKTTPRLRLDEEIREINEGLRRSNYRDRFVIYSALDPGQRDLRRALLDHNPDIVHFTGHGNKKGLLVVDEMGMAVRHWPGYLSYFQIKYDVSFLAPVTRHTRQMPSANISNMLLACEKKSRIEPLLNLP